MLCVGPLSGYPSVKGLSRLSTERWHQLGAQLGLSDDKLEKAKKSTHPTTAIFLAAKVEDEDLKWSQVVEALLRVGENTLAESICNEQGELVSGMLVGTSGWCGRNERVSAQASRFMCLKKPVPHPLPSVTFWCSEYAVLI